MKPPRHEDVVALWEELRAAELDESWDEWPSELGVIWCAPDLVTLYDAADLDDKTGVMLDLRRRCLMSVHLHDDEEYEYPEEYLAGESIYPRSMVPTLCQWIEEEEQNAGAAEADGETGLAEFYREQAARNRRSLSFLESPHLVH